MFESKCFSNSTSVLYRTTQIMAPLKHPNLVRLLGAVWNEGPDKLCLVLEYVEGGTLRDWLTPEKGGTWASSGFGFAQVKTSTHTHTRTPPHTTAVQLNLPVKTEY